MPFLLAGLSAVASAHAEDQPPRLEPEIELPRRPIDGPVTPRLDIRTRVSLESPGPIGLIGTVQSIGYQSETSIAASGSAVVVGFNDEVGTFSGYMYSSDGGNTFVDGNGLPVAPGTSVGGDPSLTVWNPPSGPPVFYYVSLFGNTSGQSSLCVHRSTDGGATWTGPFEVTAAPSGTDFCDRPWTGVDQETGRLFVSWTHFSGGRSIRVAYSDDAATGNPPTWTGPALVGTRTYDGQCSFIQPDPNGPNVYLVWESYPSSGSSNAAVSFARSTDNGLTWSAASNVATFWHHLPPYGFERWLWSVTGMSVNSVDGGIEVVFAASENGTTSGDLGDIYFIRSATQGLTWSAPIPLNAFPGTDRPQCFPTVASDASGAIHAYWYDLSCGSGVDDWTDLYHAFSTDHGATWSSPVPTTPSPFHNEAGNDFSAPAQGDYIDATLATAGSPAAIAGFAWMNEPQAVGFGADAMAVTAEPVQYAPLRLRPGSVVVSDQGCDTNDGALVAGELGFLTIPLQNIGRSPLDDVAATLSSLTAGVIVPGATQSYGTVGPGAVGSSAIPFIIQVGSGYACGQPIRLRLDYSTSTAGNAPGYLEFSLPSGVPVATTVLLSENFDAAAAPALPAGWSTLSLCSTCATSPWQTNNVLSTSPPNSAFVSEFSVPTFARLEGPLLAVPPSADYVEVRFDLWVSLKQTTNRYAPSGASFEYQLDGVGGSHFATGDAEEFQFRYTHNIARASGNGSGDRSGWSGSTGGFVPVRIRIPGLGGHSFRPRFDLTTASEASSGGVRVDNVIIKAVDLGCGACMPLDVMAGGASSTSLALLGPNPFSRETALRYSLASASHVRLEVFSIAGQRVRTLVDRVQAAGSHTVSLRSDDQSGRLRAGVYLVRLIAGGERRGLRVVEVD